MAHVKSDLELFAKHFNFIERHYDTTFAHSRDYKGVLNCLIGNAQFPPSIGTQQTDERLDYEARTRAQHNVPLPPARLYSRPEHWRLYYLLNLYDALGVITGRKTPTIDRVTEAVRRPLSATHREEVFGWPSGDSPSPITSPSPTVSDCEGEDVLPARAYTLPPESFSKSPPRPATPHPRAQQSWKAKRPATLTLDVQAAKRQRPTMFAVENEPAGQQTPTPFGMANDTISQQKPTTPRTDVTAAREQSPTLPDTS